jgi:hypothetical protein
MFDAGRPEQRGHISWFSTTTTIVVVVISVVVVVVITSSPCRSASLLGGEAVEAVDREEEELRAALRGQRVAVRARDLPQTKVQIKHDRQFVFL